MLEKVSSIKLLQKFRKLKLVYFLLILSRQIEKYYFSQFDLLKLSCLSSLS